MGIKGRRIREKGKAKLSQYFKKMDAGESVAVVPDCGFRAAFPKRIKGKTGKVKSMRGTHCMVELKDGNKMKSFIIHPVHLKKVK